ACRARSAIPHHQHPSCRSVASSNHHTPCKSVAHRNLPIRRPALQKAGSSDVFANSTPESCHDRLRRNMQRLSSSTNSHASQHPLKDPERCPHCNSRRLIRKGTRKKKLESVPLWRCKSCGRTFTPGPRPIRNKTYPVSEILEAITLFDRGYTLE